MQFQITLNHVLIFHITIARIKKKTFHLINSTQDYVFFVVTLVVVAIVLEYIISLTLYA